MGLGITVYYPANGNLKAFESFFKKVKPVVPGWDIDSQFGENGFRVELVPFEEELYGSLGDGMICISAKTNSAGPGYHAYLVELLDGIDVKPAEVCDETGYYEDRDFEKLQDSMLNWLYSLSGQILEMADGGDYSNISVCLSINETPTESKHLTCCPLGYRDRDFYERVIDGNVSGDEFFMWWNKGQNAEFYRNCALSAMWNDVNWLAPELDHESKILVRVLACLDKAYSLDDSLNYPVAEWMEVAELIQDDELTNNLQSRYSDVGESSIGYMRNKVRGNVGGWMFEHDGRMHFEADDQGTHVWRDDEMTIRVTTFNVQFKEKVDDMTEALLASVLEREQNCDRIKLPNKDIAAAIQHAQIEEDGEVLQQTRLFVTFNESLMMASLYYSDESKKDLAIEICSSVTRLSEGS